MEPKDILLKIESHRVPIVSERVRLSDYIPGIFTSLASRKASKKAIKNGLVTINGSIGFTGDYLNGEEILDLYQSPIQNKKPSIDLKLNVLFEDDYLAIVYKPAGIVVSGNKKFTLENALGTNLKKSLQKDALQRPEPVHRLDYPTSGALLIAKTAAVLIDLNQMFEAKTIKKVYTAVTMGLQSKAGTIETDIDAKLSKTIYTLLQTMPSQKYGALNLMELEPCTGRKHQLRKHMASIGNPIFGDLLYGIEGENGKGNGLYLHAFSIQFQHPIMRTEVSVHAPLPKKFEQLFQNSSLCYDSIS
jgi:23S rRNA pseudouridine1911/1915/1917 synthase